MDVLLTFISKKFVLKSDDLDGLALREHISYFGRQLYNIETGNFALNVNNNSFIL